MTEYPALNTVRQVFALLFPMQDTIVIGGGRGQGLDGFRAATSLLVVDARAECVEGLQRQLSDWSNCTAVQAVVGGQSGAAAFHLATNAEESGLIPPETLQSLWRNLTTRSVEAADTLTVVDLLARVDPVSGYRCNWLVVDCLPALPVLEGAGRLVDDLEVLELRCVRDETVAAEHGSSLAAITQWLKARGFRLALEIEETHPQLCKAVFCRDVRVLEKTIAQLQANHDEGLRSLAMESRGKEDALARCSSLEVENTKLREAHAAGAKAHHEQEKALTAERDGLAQEKQALTVLRDGLTKSLKAEAQAKADALSSLEARQKQLEDCLKQLQALKDEAQLSKAIQGLTDQLRTQHAGLAEQLHKQSDDLVRLRKQLLAAVKQEVLNGTQQLEAFLDIQNFFKNGEHLPAMHGWPISPDFARYLIQLLEKNDYGLILEFGSGTSTVIIAKTLAHLDRTRQGNPAPLQVAFEHLDKYYGQTLADLRRVGLAQSVELTLAPLRPYQPPNGNTYSYYACHEKLADLATRLPATPVKILMVVDGPPASIGQHARYPALPAVLAHLKGNGIDILLDDYARPDEKEVGLLWEKDLEQLGYKLLSEKISMEKEALFISASPQ